MTDEGKEKPHQGTITGVLVHFALQESLLPEGRQQIQTKQNKTKPKKPTLGSDLITSGDPLKALEGKKRESGL